MTAVRFCQNDYIKVGTFMMRPPKPGDPGWEAFKNRFIELTGETYDEFLLRQAAEAALNPPKPSTWQQLKAWFLKKFKKT